jgi:hypothetical protein
MRQHYAEVFAIRDGRHRLVADAAGRLEHCSEGPAWSTPTRMARPDLWLGKEP